MTKIKDIPLEERPMEHLMEYGVSKVSNEELLAILLKTGNKKASSKELAIQLLSSLESIQDLNQITLEELLQFPGIGSMKASTILSAIELGKRIHRTTRKIQGKQFRQASLIFHYYQEILNDKKQECVYGVYLNQQKRIIKDKLLFIGTINYSMIHPREIFKEAYLAGATAFICVHNHPTGEVSPSREDVQMTENLKQVGNLLGIPLLDHIIIGNDTYYSFFENGEIG